jgi:phycocyanobilin lyase alpha subunit
MGDARAVEPLRQCLQCDDFYVREAAAQSLGMLGDRGVIPDLQALIASGWDAAQSVPGRPHLAQPCEAVLEALGQLNATEAIATVQVFLDHPLERVRYAANRAMYQLTRSPEYGERLVEALTGADLQLRRVALSDLGAVGYLPAAPAIAQAAVESSFKLFALKGLLDYALAAETADPEVPRQIMALMDSLL